MTFLLRRKFRFVWATALLGGFGFLLFQLRDFRLIREQTEWIEKVPDHDNPYPLHEAEIRNVFYYAGLDPIGERSELRFYWLRSFHPTILLRCYQNSPSEFCLVAFEKRDMLGLPLWKKVREVRRKARTEIDLVEVRLDRAGFWEQPMVNPDFTEKWGLDGSRWLIHAKVGDREHCVYRWSPGAGDPVQAMVENLLLDLIDDPLCPIY
jgi:hypothetical protein